MQSLPAGTPPSLFKPRLCSWLNPAFLIPKKVHRDGKCLICKCGLLENLPGLTCGNCFFREPRVGGGSEQGDPVGDPGRSLCDSPFFKLDANLQQPRVVHPGAGCAPPSQGWGSPVSIVSVGREEKMKQEKETDIVSKREKERRL